MRTTRSGIPALIVIAGILVAAWGTFLASAIVGSTGSGVTLGAGVALTAFFLGMRHAFDADHIAAIDNVARKLTRDGRRASSVGLWFAAGHSTVVFAAILVVAIGVGPVVDSVQRQDSAFGSFAAVWGPSISSVFLLLVGALNLVALVRLVHAKNPGPLAAGPVLRTFTRLGGWMDRPWKMYAVGLLFGLGFDTASTIILLALTLGTSGSVPWWVVLVLPLLFAAGMTLCDGLNSILVARVYVDADAVGGASRNLPSVVLTSISVAIALLVGSIGFAAMLVEQFGLAVPVISAIAGIDLQYLGFVVVGLGAVAWLVMRLHPRRRPDQGTAS